MFVRSYEGNSDILFVKGKNIKKTLRIMYHRCHNYIRVEHVFTKVVSKDK